jgi:hypothetical protein
MSPTRTPGPPGRTTGSAISIPVPTTPAVVPLPHHDRAWDVSGAWPAWVRYAARQIPAAVVSAGLAGFGLFIAIETPLSDTWPAVGVVGLVSWIVGIRPRRAFRAQRAMRRQRWTAYGAAVTRTESAAWIVLQQPRKRANAHVVASMKVQGGRRTREEVATPAYEHVWFAGDPRRGGVVVPAGGGPLVYVGTFAGAKAPPLSERVANGVMPVDAVRPTLIQWVLGKVLSPTTRRNLAARAYARQLRRQKKAAERRAASAAKSAAWLKARQLKQAEWARAHPEKARKAAERVQREIARRQADRQREAQRSAAELKRQQAKAARVGKSTVVTTLRARQQAKAMRDNFGKRG